MAWRILSINLVACEMSAVVGEFFDIAFLWDWICSRPVVSAEFSKFGGMLSAALS